MTSDAINAAAVQGQLLQLSSQPSMLLLLLAVQQGHLKGLLQLQLTKDLLLPAAAAAAAAGVAVA